MDAELAAHYGQYRDSGTLTRQRGSSNGLLNSPRHYRQGAGLLAGGTLPQNYANSGNYHHQQYSDLPAVDSSSPSINNNSVLINQPQRSPPPPAQFSTFVHPGGVRTTSSANATFFPDGDLV